MKPSFSLIFLSIVGLSPTASSQHLDHHAHANQHSQKASSSTLTGKSLYNISSQWRTSDNKSVQLSSLKGSPRLLTMLYTSCSSACPMLVDKMKGVSKSLPQAERSKLQMTILSFDPKRDTPEGLMKFAAKQNLDLSTWTLLSPKSEADSNELAGVLGVQFKKIKDDYVHSNIIFLLNENGELVASDEGLTQARTDFIAKVSKLLRSH